MKRAASSCVAKRNSLFLTSSAVKIGEWDCAYSAETFQEQGVWYTTHIWVTGKDDISFECSFTVAKGEKYISAEEIIRSLRMRKNNEPKEVIPLRVLEIGEINAAFEWTSNTIKKTLTKDFTSQEQDIEKLQKLIDGGKIQVNQRNAWENIGLAFGSILENEMDGMTWVTVVDGQREYAALQFGDLVIDPSFIVWNNIKTKKACDLKAEFIRIKEEVEKRL